MKHRGSGWWGERYRHRLASLKGWRQRRTISRSLKRYHKEHLEDGHKMAKDVQIRAEATYPTSDKAAIRRWKQDPAHSDILGVDTDLWRRLKAPQVKARAIYRKSKERVQKVVQDFKVEKKRIQASKVSKREKRKRVKQEADRTIRKVGAEHDAAEKISEDAKKEQRKAIARYVKPWDRERKRRAAMVARSLASDMITADALIHRAERKGWDYDTVNWDELQGKDLMFMDRLNRLERQTGETQTRMEKEGEIDWQIEKYEAEYQEWVKAEAREVAERGETRIPKDMAMQKDLSGGGRMEFTTEKKEIVKPRRQESKVTPRQKKKDQAILTSKEDLAKSRLEKGQETLVVIVATTDVPSPEQAKPTTSKWRDSKSISYTNIGVGSRVTDKSGAVYEIVGVEVPDTVPAHRVYTLKYEHGSMGKRPTSKYGKVAEKDIILDQKLGQMERHYRKIPTPYERQEARDEAHQARRRQTWAKIEKGEHYTINASAGKKRYGDIIGKRARVVEKRDPGYSYPITVEVDGERYHLSPQALSKKRGKPSSQKSRKVVVEKRATA